jgi:hypothetical protein
MKTKTLLVRILAAFIGFATASAAEKVKHADVSDYPFYTARKRGQVAQFTPGLNAVLQLTAAQREQIAAARDEMLNDDAVKAARSLSKADPNVTAGQRDKARSIVEAATVRLQEKVTAILTPGQKTLIEKINAAHADATEEAGILYESRFSTVKDDEAARRQLFEEKAKDTAEIFQRKLDGLLTTDQKTAMARAAAEETQRLAVTAKVKKPGK